jgi:hypothetical protein
MIEPLLRRLIEHKRRKLIVTILTVLTGLLVVLPAADEYNAAKERTSTAHKDLEETKGEVKSLPRFEEIFELRMAELEALQDRTLSLAAAQNLREQLVEIVRQADCTMLQARLGDPMKRDWTTEDNAVDDFSVSNRGNPTPYQLETRQISLSIAGPMPNLLHFLARLCEIDKMIHTKDLNLKRSGSEENSAILTMDVLLFDLVKKVEE